jgi:hypothetical protein
LPSRCDPQHGAAGRPGLQSPRRSRDGIPMEVLLLLMDEIDDALAAVRLRADPLPLE